MPESLRTTGVFIASFFIIDVIGTTLVVVLLAVHVVTAVLLWGGNGTLETDRVESRKADSRLSIDGLGASNDGFRVSVAETGLYTESTGARGVVGEGRTMEIGVTEENGT